jgi:predicted MFS family arabinose efflux permease
MARGHGVLLTLTVVYAVAFIDRQVLAILQESIKRDLHLSDGQLGLLTGFSFALFYALCGVPIGRLADRRNRRDLIAAAMVIWSGITALVSQAQTFTYLLLARIGVGIGEAGVAPASCSMIADLYPPRHRAAAMCIFTAGAQVGMLFGFLLGGWLDSTVGWRMTFVLVGLPGLVVALVLKVCVREPVRAAPIMPSTSLRSGVRHILAVRTVRRLAPAAALSTLVAYAPMSWAAPYLIRVHHIPVYEVGVWLALGIGGGGIVGNLFSGIVVDRLAARDPRWYFWYPALVTAVIAPFLWGAFTAHDGVTARLFFLVPFVFGSVYAGVGLSLLNLIVPSQFRAMASALYLALTNIVGIGLGTWLIGIVSDLYAARYGAASIQHALLATVPGTAVITSLIYVWAARSLIADLPRSSSAQQ